MKPEHLRKIDPETFTKVDIEDNALWKNPMLGGKTVAEFWKSVFEREQMTNGKKRLETAEESSKQLLKWFSAYVIGNGELSDEIKESLAFSDPSSVASTIKDSIRGSRGKSGFIEEFYDYISEYRRTHFFGERPVNIYKEYGWFRYQLSLPNDMG